MFELEDGSVINLSLVAVVSPSFEGQYTIIFSGGNHETVREAHKARSEFIALLGA